MMGLPTSTVSGFSVIFVPILALQNRIRFGRDVGLLYQSPPPLYFSTAISWALAIAIKKMHKIVQRQSFPRFERPEYCITIIESISAKGMNNHNAFEST